MKKCCIKNDLGETIEVDGDLLTIRDYYGELVTDFEIKYCPFCGQPATGESYNEMIGNLIEKRIQET